MVLGMTFKRHDDSEEFHSKNMRSFQDTYEENYRRFGSKKERNLPPRPPHPWPGEAKP